MKNFRIAWNNFRTNFFTIFNIVSDVAIMQRASIRLNLRGWVFAPEAQENFKTERP